MEVAENDTAAETGRRTVRLMAEGRAMWLAENPAALAGSAADEAAAAAKALAGVSLARGLAAATHHQLDDGTMRSIAEGPGDAM